MWESFRRREVGARCTKAVYSLHVPPFPARDYGDQPGPTKRANPFKWTFIGAVYNSERFSDTIANVFRMMGCVWQNKPRRLGRSCFPAFLLRCPPPPPNLQILEVGRGNVAVFRRHHKNNNRVGRCACLCGGRHGVGKCSQWRGNLCPHCRDVFCWQR